MTGHSKTALRSTIWPPLGHLESQDEPQSLIRWWSRVLHPRHGLQIAQRHLWSMNTTRVVHTSTDELGLVTEALASPTRTTKSYSSIPCAHELVLDYLEGVEHDSAIRTNFGVRHAGISCVSLFYMKVQFWPKCDDWFFWVHCKSNPMHNMWF